MKYILILFLLISNSLFSQVDIRVNNQDVQIALIPSEEVTSVLSSIVFTLRSEQSQTFTSSDVLTQLEEVYYNGYYYNTFVYFGMNTELINERIYDIPRISGGSVEIINDTYTEDNNRNYYVAIGGEDMTGQILQMSTDIKEIQNEKNTRTLFYDYRNGKWVVFSNNQWTDLFGRYIYVDLDNLLR